MSDTIDEPTPPHRPRTAPFADGGESAVRGAETPAGSARGESRVLLSEGSAVRGEPSVTAPRGRARAEALGGEAAAAGEAGPRGKFERAGRAETGGRRTSQYIVGEDR